MVLRRSLFMRCVVQTLGISSSTPHDLEMDQASPPEGEAGSLWLGALLGRGGLYRPIKRKAFLAERSLDVLGDSGPFHRWLDELSYYLENGDHLQPRDMYSLLLYSGNLPNR